MLGQPASWQTVCRPSRLTSACSSVNSGPILARVLIHSGLRSIEVVALRASMRNMRRGGTSGRTEVTEFRLRRCDQGMGAHGADGEANRAKHRGDCDAPSALI